MGMEEYCCVVNVGAWRPPEDDGTDSKDGGKGRGKGRGTNFKDYGTIKMKDEPVADTDVI